MKRFVWITEAVEDFMKGTGQIFQEGWMYMLGEIGDENVPVKSLPDFPNSVKQVPRCPPRFSSLRPGSCLSVAFFSLFLLHRTSC